MQAFAYLVILFVLGGTFSSSIARLPLMCTVRYVCPKVGNQIYVTNDNRTCDVLPNDCYMRGHNCNLLRDNKSVAWKITKEECQNLCSEMACLAIYQPVCGLYNGQKKTFGNSCEMKSHTCSTFETYVLFNKGECDPVEVLEPISNLN